MSDQKLKTEDPGTEQSRRLSVEMNLWLELFDSELAQEEVPLPQRPLQALLMLFVHGAITVRAGDERLDGPPIARHADTLWFRVLYAAVEYWYIDRFGAAATKKSGNVPLYGVVLVRNAPFELRVPANRRKVEVEGEQAWIYFEEGLGEGELAEAWIVDGPDLS